MVNSLALRVEDFIDEDEMKVGLDVLVCEHVGVDCLLQFESYGLVFENFIDY